MAAPTIYRSSDANAPPLSAVCGSLISVLDACLIDGYGSSFASGSVTWDAVAMPADGDTLTVGSVTYTFRTSLTSQPVNTISLVGLTTAAQLNARLTNTINLTGVSNTDYVPGQVPNPDVWAVYPGGAGNIVNLTARKGGTAGNSLALARTSSGTAHLTVSGATLTGGGGSNTKAGAGWSKAFIGIAGAQAAYKQPAGCGFYLQVDDTGPGTGQGMEARCFGFETMTAYNVWTGQFPTVAQAGAGGAVLRKTTGPVTSTTARPWIMLVDDRTLYLYVQTADGGTEYVGYAFGDFYSFNAADAYKCLIIGKNGETSSALSSHVFPQVINASLAVNHGGHWLPRNFAGVGGSTNFVKNGDAGLTGASPTNLVGVMLMPNGSDGGLYLAPVRIIDGSTPGTSISGTINLRGKLRGLWHAPYPLTSFADGDTFAGSGDLVGRNFLVVRNVFGSSQAVAFVVMETTAWDTSA